MFVSNRSCQPNLEGDCCPAQSPQGPHGYYECTLPPGHEGPHVAHVDLMRFGAVWDDDRTTDH